MTYVYRLFIVFPPGSRAGGWKPPDWHLEHEGPFQWPRNRDYLSLTGAEHRASLFEKYGATVHIVRSDQVTWSGQETVKVESGSKRLLATLLRLRGGLQ